MLRVRSKKAGLYAPLAHIVLLCVLFVFAPRPPAEAQQTGRVPMRADTNADRGLNKYQDKYARRALVENMRAALIKGGLAELYSTLKRAGAETQNPSGNASKPKSPVFGDRVKPAKHPFSVSPAAALSPVDGEQSRDKRSPLDRTLDYIDLLHTPNVIERRLAVTGARPVVHIRHEAVYEPRRVQRFYEGRGFAPAWSGIDGPLPIARAMARFLYEADPIGLIRPGGYHLMALESLIDEARRSKQSGAVLTPSLLADFDILLTDAYMQRVSKHTGAPDGRDPRSEFLVERLEQTVDGKESIESLINNLDTSYESHTWALGRGDKKQEAANPYMEDPYSIGTRLLIRSRVGTQLKNRKIKIGKTRLKRPKSVARFYEVTNYGLAWSDHTGGGLNNRLNDQARIMFSAIERASEEALKPADYHAVAIRDAAGDLYGGDNALESVVVIDILLTDAFFLYASHQLGGRSVVKTVDVRSVKERPAPDIVKALTRALEAGMLEATLKGLAPAAPAYVKLRQALALYRDIGTRGEWSKIGPGRTIRPGDRGERVQKLRRRLLGTDRGAFYAALGSPRVLDDLGESGSGSGFDMGVYDDALRGAVIGFQRSHGLRETGNANGETVRALNVSVKERISQIALNMERWRWYGEILGERYIIVNTADYTMEVVEDGKSVMKMKVIVGKRHTKTPVFASEIEYLVLNPYWYAPASIEEGLIQPPGPTNPLGRVKFIFPNRYSVYLHDTPTKRLFANRSRLYSHGCVRLEKALDLAEYILGDVPDWDAERMRGVLKGRRTRRINLADPIPVYILYWTAWVDDEGRMQFRNDPYGRDRKVRRIIN